MTELERKVFEENLILPVPPEGAIFLDRSPRVHTSKELCDAFNVSFGMKYDIGTFENMAENAYQKGTLRKIQRKNLGEPGVDWAFSRRDRVV